MAKVKRHKTQLLAGEKGLTLIEVLIAGSIFAFVLLSFGYLFAIAQGLLGGESERRMAAALANEAIEVQTATAATSSGFASLESAVGTISENPISSNQAPYYTPSDYPNHRRDTTIAYVQDCSSSPCDYDTVVSGPTDTLRISVTVSPSGSRPVEFAPVSLVTVVTRP